MPGAANKRAKPAKERLGWAGGGGGGGGGGGKKK
jgi:hypothetical protein